MRCKNCGDQIIGDSVHGYKHLNQETYRGRKVCVCGCKTPEPLVSAEMISQEVFSAATGPSGQHFIECTTTDEKYALIDIKAKTVMLGDGKIRPISDLRLSFRLKDEGSYKARCPCGFKTEPLDYMSAQEAKREHQAKLGIHQHAITEVIE